jgi:hypothetical protein
MSANTFWDGGESDFPASGSPRQKLGYALKCATLAAPMDEWLPWQFLLDDERIDLVADTCQPPETADPDGRELMIRCGAALFHLKLALKRFGCLGQVELFPELDRHVLVARVHYGRCHDGGAQAVALFEAMSRGREKSTPWSEVPVSEYLLQMFEGVAAGEKAWLEFSHCESSRDRLVELAEPGGRAPMAVHHREALSGNSRVAQWTRPLLTFVVRVRHSGNIAVETGGSRADQMAALAVIKTKTDDWHGWLAAGQAMARVSLQARVSEVSAQIFDQACRSRYVREELRTSIGHKGFAQTIIGFGSHPSSSWATSSLAWQPASREGEPGTVFPSRLRMGR